jgi:hypothetical protein
MRLVCGNCKWAGAGGRRSLPFTRRRLTSTAKDHSAAALPSAAGGTARPTKPAKATIVST